jgi:hypothetical protein
MRSFQLTARVEPELEKFIRELSFQRRASMSAISAALLEIGATAVKTNPDKIALPGHNIVPEE